jgi:hypothetical protein
MATATLNLSNPTSWSASALFAQPIVVSMPFLINDTRSLNAFAVEMLTRLGIYQYTCHLQLLSTSTRRKLNAPSLRWMINTNFRLFVITTPNSYREMKRLATRALAVVSKATSHGNSYCGRRDTARSRESLLLFKNILWNESPAPVNKLQKPFMKRRRYQGSRSPV